MRAVPACAPGDIIVSVWPSVGIDPLNNYTAPGKMAKLAICRARVVCAKTRQRARARARIYVTARTEKVIPRLRLLCPTRFRARASSPLLLLSRERERGMKREQGRYICALISGTTAAVRAASRAYALSGLFFFPRPAKLGRGCCVRLQ